MSEDFPLTFWHTVNIFSDWGLLKHLPKNGESKEIFFCVAT